MDESIIHFENLFEERGKMLQRCQNLRKGLVVARNSGFT